MKEDSSYDSYFKVRKPTAKSTIVLNGGVRRLKDKIRNEIEDGLQEWEEGENSE